MFSKTIDKLKEIGNEVDILITSINVIESFFKKSNKLPLLFEEKISKKIVYIMNIKTEQKSLLFETVDKLLKKNNLREE
jgi:hypothetical protein|tara:strand:- start:660 stop:896 length:237 start_codon:yes stop_codon:yes gene_type:complete